MFLFGSHLLALYLKLIVGVSLGWFLGRQLPNSIPTYLGQVLFWFGVPLGIVAFLRQADLSTSVLLSPIIAWIALFLGAALAWLWLRRDNFSRLSKPAQGSFLLASMVGNTGYLGFPVSLAIVGEKYFSWALFYDLLGSTLGAYGLGVILAAYFGNRSPNFWQLSAALVKNPALWSLFLGLWLRNYPLPNLAEASLKAIGWTVISSALVLIGMRLSQINSWQKLPVASVSLGIKMLLVPLILGFALSKIGITGSPQMAIVLQMGMPPAFATLVIAEAYNLDRDLAVTTLALGSIGLLLTLPIWLWLF
jgi:hypothetical protein